MGAACIKKAAQGKEIVEDRKNWELIAKGRRREIKLGGEAQIQEEVINLWCGEKARKPRILRQKMADPVKKKKIIF